ncbi:hypothetical protein [Paenibacillus chitinolyticus]
MGKKMMFTAIGLGAAYLLRNKDARQKLKDQFQSFAGSAKSQQTLQ